MLNFLSVSLCFVVILHCAAICLSAQNGIRLDRSFSSKGFKRIGFGWNESNFKGVGVQPSGKIIAVGSAATPRYADNDKDFDFLIALYNADGSLDGNFGDGGKILDDLGGLQDDAEALTVLPDGKFIIVGGSTGRFLTYRLVVAKYNADGTPDLSFGENGKFFLSDQAGSTKGLAVTAQTDGKIVVAGSSDDFFVIRVNANGSLDTNFGNSGIVITPVGSGSDLITDLAVQTDGKIVAGGTSVYTYGRNDFAVVRYNADGSLDNSFGEAGKVWTDFSYNDDRVQSVLLQADGKIIAAGYGQDYQGYGFALVRYNTDGSLDYTFNGTGKVFTPSSSSDILSDSIIQSDGKIVVFGNTDSDSANPSAFRRYNPNGSLDTSFGQNGTAVVSFAPTSFAKRFVIQPDGKFVAAGTGNGNPFNSTLTRINADGSLDNSFNQTGKIVQTLGNAASYLNAMKVQPDGKIVAAGFSYQDQTYHFAVARFNLDGSLDATFNGTGTVLTKIEEFTSSDARAVDLQADGKIIAAGSSNGGFTIVRYNTDGSLDTSFGGTGKVIVPFGENYALCNSVAVQPDGKIIAAGNVASAQGNFTLVRLNADGSLDTTFNNTGKVNTQIGAYSGIKDIKLQPDGKILANGFFDGGGATARYNPNGSLDTSFNQTGIVTNSRVFLFDKILIQADGKILSVGANRGANNRGFVLSRYYADGSPDTAFGTDGTVVTQVEESHFEKVSATLDADSRIIVGGSLPGSFSFDYVLARYQTDGNLDSTFISEENIEKSNVNLPKGIVRLSLGKYSEVLTSLTIDEQGRYLLGGQINRTFAITRLLPDGQPAATAAISGRVINSNGAGLPKIMISLRDVETGIILTTRTNSFGKFNFDGLTIGNLYVVTVHGGRRYQFDQSERTLQLWGNIGDLDFIESGQTAKR